MRFCQQVRKVWLSVGAREVSTPSLESSGASDLFYSFGRDILKHPVPQDQLRVCYFRPGSGESIWLTQEDMVRHARDNERRERHRTKDLSE